jgi:hypothetical protein
MEPLGILHHKFITQVENDHVIRFWPAEERWIIDLEAGTWA